LCLGMHKKVRDGDCDLACTKFSLSINSSINEFYSMSHMAHMMCIYGMYPSWVEYDYDMRFFCNVTLCCA
jgi:hypothetical protein